MYVHICNTNKKRPPLFRYMLQDKDPSAGVYFGRHFKPYVKNGYMSGGAGYVLSKEALKVNQS